jgi:lipid-A-disaccharide synthase
VRGVAGPALRGAGVEEVVAMEGLAMLGFSDILFHLPALFAARRRLLAELERFSPHAVVLVDYPGFNLRFGPLARRRGARLFYYIAPQVWAWHRERAAAMAKWVERLAVVFPFEEPLFREAGVPTTFVGHPLLDGLRPEVEEGPFRSELGVEPDARLLGLLPGSRSQEVAHNLPPMLAAARLLARDRPALVPVVALVSHLDPGALAAFDLAGVKVARDRTHAIQAFATACAVASGTATLETALLGTPLVVVYRVGALNFAIGRRLVTLERIGLPNIVAGATVAPELVQHDFTPQRLAGVLGGWLDDPARLAAQRAGLRVLRERLGGPGASRQAAELLWSMVA